MFRANQILLLVSSIMIHQIVWKELKKINLPFCMRTGSNWNPSSSCGTCCRHVVLSRGKKGTAQRVVVVVESKYKESGRLWRPFHKSFVGISRANNLSESNRPSRWWRRRNNGEAVGDCVFWVALDVILRGCGFCGLMGKFLQYCQNFMFFYCNVCCFVFVPYFLRKEMKGISEMLWELFEECI